MSMRIALFANLFVPFIAVLCIAAAVQAANHAPREPWTTSAVKGSPTPPDPYEIEVAFPHLRFTNPTSILEIPSANRLVVSEMGGKIFSFLKDTALAQPTLVADLSAVSGGRVSLYDVTLHPDFETNRFLFVCHGHPDGQIRVSRYKVNASPELTLVSGSEKVMLKWPAGGHGGGCIKFGPDGFLYISTGDASGPAPPDKRTTGQDVSDLLGSVLRIDVNVKDGDTPYLIPESNPFVSYDGVRPEIYSYGLRNPWKFGIDRISGEVLVADNGWETWEMIHKLHAGSNCGWPIMEGRAPLRMEVQQGPTPITPPVKDHPHTEANSVIGGPVYHGSAFPELDGSFVYGDYITGTIWSLTTTDGYVHRTLVDTDLHIVAFTEGSLGEIYVLDYDQTGQIYQLKSSDTPDTSAAFPRKLSDTGIFESVRNLHPARGVVPYSVVAEPWADGATARRWVAIPGKHRIKLRPSGSEPTQFPDGTVLVKHLSLPRSSHRDGELQLETQLLHFESGHWNPYTYLWDSSGTDATLVDPSGEDVVIEETDDPNSIRTWRAASVNECRLCHSAGIGFVAGFNARQLNRLVGAPTDQVSQIEKLAASHVLISSNSDAGQDSILVDPHDSSQPLEARARSYLHSNCGVCHNRQGPATISFYAHVDYPYDQLRITKRPGIGSFGLSDSQLIKAGAPFRSVILYRMSKLGYGRMPYIGSRVVDRRGVALIADWIGSMPAKPNGVPAPTATAKLKTSGTDLADLLKTTEGALALTTAMHRGEIPTSDYASIIRAASSKNGDIRGLYDHFVPESLRLQTLGANPDVNAILDLVGNAKRGELIFMSDNNRCRNCHDVSDSQKSLGPTLADIRLRKMKASELLQQIVQPSARIDDKYATWTVVTTDGSVESGLLESRENGAVEFRKADKTIVGIERTDVEDMKKSTQSLMPNGLLSDMTAQQAADLIEFLIGAQ